MPLAESTATLSTATVDISLWNELRGWYHMKKRFAENEAWQRFYFDFYGAKGLAFANGLGNVWTGFPERCAVKEERAGSFCAPGQCRMNLLFAFNMHRTSATYVLTTALMRAELFSTEVVALLWHFPCTFAGKFRCRFWYDVDKVDKQPQILRKGA